MASTSILGSIRHPRTPEGDARPTTAADRGFFTGSVCKTVCVFNSEEPAVVGFRGGSPPARKSIINDRSSICDRALLRLPPAFWWVEGRAA